MLLVQLKSSMYKKNKFFYFYNKKFMQFLNKKCLSSNLKVKNKIFFNSNYIKTINNNKNILNLRIENSIYNYNTTKNNNIIFPKENNFSPIWLKNASVYNFSEINFSIKKELLLLRLEKRRQLFYFIKEYIIALKNFNKTLIREGLPIKDKISPINGLNWYLQYTNTLKIFYQKYFGNILFKTYNQNNNDKTLYNLNNNNLIVSSLIQNFYICGFNNNLTTSNINIFFKELFIFNTTLNNQWILNHFISDINYKTSLTYKKNFNKNIIKFQQKAQAIFITRNFIKSKIIKNFFQNKKNTNINNIIWKKNNSLFQKQNFNLKKLGTKQFFILPTNRLTNISNTNYYITKKNKKRYHHFAHILYILIRLEEKIDLLAKNDQTKILSEKLTELYNLLYLKIANKNARITQSSLILGNLNELIRIRKNEWKNIFFKTLNNWIEENIKYKNKNILLLNNFFNKIQKKLSHSKKNTRIRKINLKTKDIAFKNINSINYKINKTKNFFTLSTKQKKVNGRLTIRKNLLNEKLILKNNQIKFHQHKEVLSILTNKKVKIFFINALSLTKYAFNLERKLEKKEKRSPTTFLQNIDRDMINKYKYIGIYIKDLIRVCFIGMFLKKATFMAKFIAFQIAKLPRNRKETSFVRFIIKIVKTFAAERDEILGLRIKFKGRVNRWRRTKSITGERGVIPLHTIDNRIECGSAQAINRKGALGIRIWIRYKPSFSTLIKSSIIKYFAYSKKLRLKKKLPRYIYFTRKH